MNNIKNFKKIFICSLFFLFFIIIFFFIIKLNFIDLKTELNKQSDTTITEDLTIENTDLILTNIDLKTLAKTKSIKTYGNLIKNNLIVSFEKTEFKFNIEGNVNKLNFVDLKTEYNKQSDALIIEDLTIENIDSLLSNIDSISLTNANSKKTSIETYGDLTTELFVLYDETDKRSKFHIGGNKENAINAKELATEYLKQTGKKITTKKQIIEKLNINRNSLNIAIRKGNSITIYGDLKTTLFVSFDEEYKFNTNEKKGQKLNFVDLKTEYNKQSDTLITDDLTIENIDSVLTNIDTTTLNEAKTKSKTTSIETYGDLTATLFVSFDEEYKFNIKEKEGQKLNFVDLKIQYNKQSDTPITEDLTILNIGSVTNSLLTNIDEKTLAKAKENVKKASIETYGDLINGRIKVDYDGINYIFQVGEKTELNLDELNTQLNNQGDTEEDYTIDNLPLNFDFIKTLAKAKAKKYSIETFGNLKIDLIKVDYDGIDYTFQVGDKLKISLEKLNNELNIQDDTVEDDYTINNLPITLNFNGVDQAKAKKNSIDTYGDLRDDSIEIDYDWTNYTFQVGDKLKISLKKLNDELNKQGDTVKDDYTIDNFGSLNIDWTKLIPEIFLKNKKYLLFLNQQKFIDENIEKIETIEKEMDELFTSKEKEQSIIFCFNKNKKLIYCTERKEHYYYDITSSATEISVDLDLTKIKEVLRENKDFAYFIDIHNHPSKDGIHLPSETDLKASANIKLNFDQEYWFSLIWAEPKDQPITNDQKRSWISIWYGKNLKYNCTKDFNSEDQKNGCKNFKVLPIFEFFNVENNYIIHI